LVLHWRLPDSEKIIPTFRRVGEIRRGLSCGGSVGRPVPTLIAVSYVKAYLKRSKKEAHRSADRPTGLFSLRSAELIERRLMQEANLSQVSLRFRNVVPYDTQLVPDCNLARMMQGGFKALDAKLSTSGKGISLLYVVAG
jgi:hypothetical protein